jgi:hypothetical protein
MSEPEKMTAERMTPEEEAAARAAPTIKVRAKSLDPVHPDEVIRARRRGFAVGVALAAGAGVAAAVGYLFWGKRKPQRRKHA